MEKLSEQAREILDLIYYDKTLSKRDIETCRQALCDGHLLKRLEIDDQEAVEEAYDFLTSIINQIKEI